MYPYHTTSQQVWMPPVVDFCDRVSRPPTCRFSSNFQSISSPFPTLRRCKVSAPKYVCCSFYGHFRVKNRESRFSARPPVRSTSFLYPKICQIFADLAIPLMAHKSLFRRQEKSKDFSETCKVERSTIANAGPTLQDIQRGPCIEE